MLNLRSLGMTALALAAGLLAGCGGSYSGVQALAPAAQDKLVGTAPDSGQYTLYLASGYIEDHDPNIRPVWTVSLSGGQRVGFRWATDKQHPYEPHGSFHLIAFAGGQTRDLGTFNSRDVKYVWAGSKGDVNGYFQSRATHKAITHMMME